MVARTGAGVGDNKGKITSVLFGHWVVRCGTRKSVPQRGEGERSMGEGKKLVSRWCQVSNRVEARGADSTVKYPW